MENGLHLKEMMSKWNLSELIRLFVQHWRKKVNCVLMCLLEFFQATFVFLFVFCCCGATVVCTYSKLFCSCRQNIFIFFQTTNSLFSLNFLTCMAFSRLKLIMNVLAILSYTVVVRYEDSNVWKKLVKVYSTFTGIIYPQEKNLLWRTIYTRPIYS